MGKATPHQERQYSFLDAQIAKESRVGLSQTRDYTVTCHTCNVRETSHTPEGAIRFIGKHEGHTTWLDTSRFYEP